MTMRTATALVAAAALAALAFALPGCARAEGGLELEVYTAGDRGYGVTSTVIYGETEAILVDAQFLNSDAAALADRIDALGRDLRAIVVTHPDADHYIGLALLHERFPGAKLYMTDGGVAAFEEGVGEVLEQFRKSKTQSAEAPESEPTPEPLPRRGLRVDGEKVEIVRDLQGDYGTKPLNSAVWVPSIRALIASDLAFEGVHLWLDKSTPAGRAQWRSDLARLEAMKPDVVVAGHKRDPNAADSPAVLAATRGYLEAFDRQRAANADEASFVAAMQREYPDWIHPLFLTIAAKSVYAE